MNQHYDAFRKKLQEIFMMDHAELDFGIYRIMNHKRKQINDFLDNQLLPQVEQTLKEYVKTDDSLQQELNKAIEGCKNLGIDPDTNPKVQQLREQIAQSSTSIDDLQNTVFSRLTQFFSRYYEGGDFVSQRRYKSSGNSAYAIPYNGEEVKLYWANYDQYYIKTSEYFKNYTFKLRDGRRICFVLVDASTEQNNNKNTNGMERRFDILRTEEGKPVVEEVDGELHISFTYELMPKATKQKDLNGKAFEALKAAIPSAWNDLLTKEQVTDSSVLLEKHINAYTAKNSFDYFIHKDLGGFLNRELDFYIKNEVFVIADLDAAKLQSQLAIVKAIEKVGQKIIDFLAQLENFQKRLWLKKKFVVQSDYCITLDRVPEKFYQEICENDDQRREWVHLFAIDEIKGDGLFTKGYSEPLTIDFLKQNPFLVLDTKFFSLSFKHKLMAGIGDLDEQTNGLLINSENFQALQLLRNKYVGEIGVTVTDPPYNTGDDDFLYKDNYSDSSWLSMMYDRMQLIYLLMKDKSWCSFNINDVELFNLMKMSELFDWSSKTNITVKMSHLSGMKMSHIDKKIPKIKESIMILSKGEDYRLNPIYEPCSWDEAFERYTSWADFNNSTQPEDWTRTTVREAAKKRNIDIGNQSDFDDFRIQNAKQIFRTAVNDTLSAYPKDGKFHTTKSANGLDKIVYNSEEVLFANAYMREIDGQMMPVQPKGDIWSDIGINNVHNEGGVQLPNGKKPVKLFERLIKMLSDQEIIILDPFAGSATIVHATINAADNHKYIAIQSDYEYFNEKTKRRSENVIYSSEWKLDKPVSRKGISQCFKYIRLEQYEDTLNNLELNDSFGKNANESYMLRYMLDTETRDSLINTKDFVRPFDYTIKTTRDNELVDTPVDLVDTFNYLIGLHVESVRWHKDENICVVEGTTHIEKEHALVIWRNQDVIKNDDLNDFFRKQDYSTLDHEFDVIYVNGDNTLPNIKSDEEHWKVRLIEQELMKRMFEEE